MKTTKRSLTTLLTAIFIIGNMQLAAFAVETTNEQTSLSSSAESASIYQESQQTEFAYDTETDGKIIDLNTSTKIEGLTLQSANTEPVINTHVTIKFNAETAEIKEPTVKNQNVSLRATWDNPLIAYYDGIEGHAIESLLYYLSSNQNDDGSFGKYRKYEITSQIVRKLSDYDKISNDQYAAAVDYLKTASPDNNLEKAIQVRLLTNFNEPYQDLLDELTASQNDDGGFGLNPYFASDVETTLEVLWAFTATGNESTDQFDEAFIYVIGQIDNDGTMDFGGDSKPSYYLINKTAEYLEAYEDKTINSVPVQTKIDQLLNYLDVNCDGDTGELTDSEDVIDTLMTLYSFQIYDHAPEKQKLLFDVASYQQHYNGSFGKSYYALIAAMKALPQPDLIITSLSAQTPLTNNSPAIFAYTFKNVGYRETEIGYYTFFDNFLLGEKREVVDVDEKVVLNPRQEVEVHDEFQATIGFMGDVNVAYYVEVENESDYENNWKEIDVNFAANPSGDPALPLYYSAAKWQKDGDSCLNLNWQYKDDVNRSNYVFMYKPEPDQYNPNPSWGAYHIENPSIDGDKAASMVCGFMDGYQYEISIGVKHKTGNTITYASQDITTIDMSSDPDEYLGDVYGYATLNNEKLPAVKTMGFGVLGDTDWEGNFEYAGIENGTAAAWADEPYLEPFITRFAVPSNGQTTDVRIVTRLKEDGEAPAITHLTIQGEDDLTFDNQQQVKVMIFGSDNIAVKEADLYCYDPQEDMWYYLGTEAFNGNQATYVWYVPAEILGSGYQIKAKLRDHQGNSSSELTWGPFEVTAGAPSVDTTPPTVTYFAVMDESDMILKNQNTAQILTQASDDFGLAEADLYYFDPGRDEWIYLDTEAMNSSQIVYDWNIPADLLGVGFQLKTIVWDTSNQASAEAVWGPFEIVSGAPPTGSISVLGLDENKWYLGETKTITWQFANPEEINYISDITLHYGASSCFLVNNYDIEKNTFSYTMPMSASYASDNAYVDIDACDVNNNCTTLDSDIFQIIDNSIMPPPPWGVPDQLAELDLNIEHRLVREIVKHNDGVIGIVYVEREGNYSTAEGQYRRLYYRQFKNSAWQEPVLIEEYWYQKDTNQNYILFDSDIEVAQTTNDHLHIAYELINESDTRNSEIIHAQIDNNSLVAKKQISIDGSSPNRPRIAADDSQVHIVWEAEDDQENTKLYYISGDGLNAWDPIGEIAGNVSAQAISLEGAEPIVTYTIDGQIHFIKNESGVWTSPVASTFRDVAREEFAGFTEDFDKLHLIIDEHESDIGKFTWKSGIDSLADLDSILSANQFTYSSQIGELWTDNEYTYLMENIRLFSRGNNIYDLFYLQGNSSFNFNVVSFSVDPIGGTGEIISFHELAQDVNAYKVIQNAQNIYHVFYENDHASHLIFDGDQAFHNKIASQYSMDVWHVIGGANNNDLVDIYYFGMTNGTDYLYQNAADYSDLIDYKITPLHPRSNQEMLNQPFTFSWEVNQEFDSYDLYMGQSPTDMEPVAADVIDAYYTLSTFQSNFDDNQTYYWQVIAKNGAQTIDSAIWSFDIRPYQDPPSLAFIEPDGVDDAVNALYTFSWQDDDLNETTRIYFYYDTDNQGEDGVPIRLMPFSEADTTNRADWDTADVAEGQYYIYAIVDDGFNETVTAYSPGQVTISRSINTLPTFHFTQPDGVDDAADQDFTIRWTDRDDEDDAQISLYYDTDDHGENGVLIVQGISEDDEADNANWPTLSIDEGSYYLYAVIDDGFNAPVVVYGQYPVNIDHDDPPTITVTGPDTGNNQANTYFQITWQDQDPEQDAKISLYYDTDNSGKDGYLIAENISEDSGDDTYLWDTSTVVNGNYYIYAKIDDGVNTTVTSSYSGAAIMVDHDYDLYVEAKILDEDGAATDYFGRDIAIDGANALAGAEKINSTGAAYVFTNSNGVWSETDILLPSDGASNDYFGRAVDIHGNWAVSGVPKANEYMGAAYVYKNTGGTWHEHQKVLGSDISSPYTFFGQSIAIDDSRFAVGAYHSSGSGAVYVFKLEGDAWVEEAKLLPDDGMSGDWFGGSVDIKDDLLIAGAEFHGSSDQGAAYVFRLGVNGWEQEDKLTDSAGQANAHFGSAVGIDGDWAVVGASGSDPACIFKNINGTWLENQRAAIRANSVAINDGFIVMGSIADNDNKGSVVVFKGKNDEYVYQNKIIASDGENGDIFGCSVDISDNHIIVGAYQDDDNGNAAGSAYIYKITAQGPNTPPTIDLVEPDGADDFADASFTIQWTDSDPDDNAFISLYYDTDNQGNDGVFINETENIREDDGADSFTWDTTAITANEYYVYAVINDAVNDPVIAYSAGKVTVAHNRPPVASDDTAYTIDEGGTLTVAAPGVLTNDTDLDNDALTAILEAGVSHESDFTLNPDGSFTYTHDGSETTADSFTYIANDGALDSGETAVVSIAINPIDDPPTVANPISDITADEDASNQTIDLSAVFSDIDDDDGSVLKNIQNNSNPSLVLASIGADTLTLNFQNDQSGTANITVEALSNFQTVTDEFTVTVNPVNDPPTISDIPNQDTDEDQTIENIHFTIGDMETLSDQLVVTSTSDNQDLIPDQSIILAGADQNRSIVSISPVPDQHGAANVTVEVRDAEGETATETFVVTVNSINDSPHIEILEPDGTDDAAIQTFTVAWTDEDPDDDAQISLYYDTDDSGGDGVLIKDDISEDDEADSWTWDASPVAEGEYYIYAVIDDGENEAVTVYGQNPVSIFPGFTACSDIADVPQAECEAIVALYSATAGDNWTNKGNWLFDKTVDNWNGVTTENGHIIAINLNSNQLIGAIPGKLGALGGLEHLDLGANQLTGAIPGQLSGLANLEYLSLYSNQITGRIPSELGNLSNLSHLYLFDNQLYGCIPASLGDCYELLDLRLDDNMLLGEVPLELIDLTNLRDFESDFRGNHLYTTSTDIRDFLNQKQIGGDWESFQTFEVSIPMIEPSADCGLYTGGNCFDSFEDAFIFATSPTVVFAAEGEFHETITIGEGFTLELTWASDFSCNPPEGPVVISGALKPSRDKNVKSSKSR